LDDVSLETFGAIRERRGLGDVFTDKRQYEGLRL